MVGTMKYLILITGWLLASIPCFAGNALLVDPTRPAGARVAAPAIPAFHVEAIMIAENTRWAIVNGTLVHQGDHVANAIVEDINPNSVRYTRGGHSETATLMPPVSPVRRNESVSEESP